MLCVPVFVAQFDLITYLITYLLFSCMEKISHTVNQDVEQCHNAYHSPVASRPVPMASVQAENIVDLVEKVDAVNA